MLEQIHIGEVPTAFFTPQFFSLHIQFCQEPIQQVDVFQFIHFGMQVRIMQQHSNSKEFVTLVAIDDARQSVVRQGMRYVLTFGLLGVIFVSSTMLVIFAS